MQKGEKLLTSNQETAREYGLWSSTNPAKLPCGRRVWVKRLIEAGLTVIDFRDFLKTFKKRSYREGNLMGKIQSIILLLALSALSVTAAAQASKKTATAVPGTKEAYCTSTGGLVETRHAVYGTNNPPQDWLPLAAVEGFCQYTSATDGSRIHVSLLTLYTTKPTLAALAYYAQIPWNGQGNGNPASFYCTQIGGAEIGATEAAGGAWVTTGGIDDLLESCVFPDNSTIDSWGLLYHSVGTIRGTDLSTVLKYSNPYPKKSE
jgi:putative hemolysin